VLLTVGFYPRLLTDIIKQSVAMIVPAESGPGVAAAPVANLTKVPE